MGKDKGKEKKKIGPKGAAVIGPAAGTALAGVINGIVKLMGGAK